MGLLLATHQAETKHSSGLVIQGLLVSFLKSSLTRSQDWDSNSSWKKYGLYCAPEPVEKTGNKNGYFL